MAQKHDYFGLSPLVSLVLAIIPFTSWVCGALTRLKEGKLIAAIIRVFGGFNIIWILDLFCMLTKKSICRILDI